MGNQVPSGVPVGGGGDGDEHHAYTSRFRRQSISAEAPHVTLMPTNSKANGDAAGDYSSAGANHAHLPQKGKSIRSNGVKINNLLGIPTPAKRIEKEKCVSPGAKMFNSLLSKSGGGDGGVRGERERHASGGRSPGKVGPIPMPRWNRRASVDVATTSTMAVASIAAGTVKLGSQFKTLVEERRSGGGGDERPRSPSARNRISKARDLFIPASRRRRPSADQGPIVIKSFSDDKDSFPKIPESLIFEPAAVAPVRQRARALTIANGHAAKASMHLALQTKMQHDREMVHTVFKYTCAIQLASKEDEKKGGKSKQKRKGSSDDCDCVRVFVAGTMTEWESHEMVQEIGETYYCSILECAAGDIYFKFCICKGDKPNHHEWVVDTSQEVVCNDDPRNPVLANIIRVTKSDREVFAALTVDSFSVRKETGEKRDAMEDQSWTRKRPQLDRTTSAATEKGPPILPPHLFEVLLNKEEVERGPRIRPDKTLLPEPGSHVMLNHLYAQSIKDNLLVLASTTRFRKKAVTIVYYKSLADEGDS